MIRLITVRSPEFQNELKGRALRLVQMLHQTLESYFGKPTGQIEKFCRNWYRNIMSVLIFKEEFRALEGEFQFEKVRPGTLFDRSRHSVDDTQVVEFNALVPPKKSKQLVSYAKTFVVSYRLSPAHQVKIYAKAVVHLNGALLRESILSKPLASMNAPPKRYLPITESQLAPANGPIRRQQNVNTRIDSSSRKKDSYHLHTDERGGYKQSDQTTQQFRVHTPHEMIDDLS
jgi:hypothetical protein